jgi:hypothetical protein
LLSASHFSCGVGFGFLYAYKLRKQVQLNKINSEMKYQPANGAQPNCLKARNPSLVNMLGGA